MAPENRNRPRRKNPRRPSGTPPAARKGSPRGNRDRSGRGSRSGKPGRSYRSNRAGSGRSTPGGKSRRASGRSTPGRSPGGKSRRASGRRNGPSGRGTSGRSSGSRPGRGGWKGGRGAGPRSGSEPARKPDRKAPHSGAGPADLPRWIRDEIRRVTRKDRQEAALRILAEGVKAFGKEEYRAAWRDLARAKELTPRSSAVRELLALSGYRLEMWSEALAELRAYRRLTGDTTHMPVEMDALRALDRGHDVEKTWTRFRDLGGNRPTEAEARVVYGSYLLDEGRPAEAWKVTGPTRLPHDPRAYELRVWFVAARSALALGEPAAARKIAAAIRKTDPDLPGLADLMSGIPSRKGRG